MRYCNECRLNVMDDTLLCPLCSNELKKTDDKKEISLYPILLPSSSSYTFFKKLLLLLSVIVSVTSIAINLYISPDNLWSGIVIATILYSWFAISNLLRKNTNQGFKIFIQVILVSILLVIIDIQTGYSKWSVTYVLPVIFSIGTIAVFFVILFDRTDWAKYVVYQWLIALFGFLPFILYFTGLANNFLFSLVSMIVSLISLLVTIFLGDKSIKSEFKRRLHF